ncbi:double-strand-break repair protein rad21 homolog isoform X3 [Zophobas morio]
MFYSKYVFAKSGPLGKIWLAAHWEKKLTKQHVMQTDINRTVETIVSDYIEKGSQIQPISLRTSGHLLLGVVKIFFRKVQYLYIDVTETLTRIKSAFRTGRAIDLKDNRAVAKESAITMKLDSFDLDFNKIFNENDVIMGDELYTAPEQDITLDSIEIPRHADLSSIGHVSDDVFAEVPRREDTLGPQKGDILDAMTEEFLLPIDNDFLAEEQPADLKELETPSIDNVSFSFSGVSPLEDSRRDSVAELESPELAAGKKIIHDKAISALAPATRPAKRSTPLKPKEKSSGAKRVHLDAVLDLEKSLFSAERAEAEDVLPLQGSYKPRTFNIDVEKLFAIPATEEFPREILNLFEKNKEPAKHYPTKSSDKLLIGQNNEATDASHGDFSMDTLDLPADSGGLSFATAEASLSPLPVAFEAERQITPFVELEVIEEKSLEPAEVLFEIPQEAELVELDEKNYELLNSKDEQLKLAKMKEIINEAFREQQSNWISFDDLLSGHSRRLAAVYFYELLSLAQCRNICIRQERPFNEIIIQPFT